MGAGYSTRLAARHLARGARRPRDAMREALEAGLSEPWRVTLFVVSTTAVALIDPAEDSILRQVGQEIAALGSHGEIALRLALSLGLIVGASVALYVIASAGIWCFARLTPESPSWAIVRSALAMATWAATLPSLAAPLVFGWLGLGWASSVVMFALSMAYTGICLSEASGIDSHRAMAFATGGTVLSLVIVLGVAFGLFGEHLRDLLQ